MVQRIARFLGSWWPTAVLLLFMSAAYVSFASGDDPFGKWIDFLFRTPLGVIAYGALTANLLLASVRIIRGRLNVQEIASEKIRNMDVYAEIPALDHNAFLRMAAWMKTNGFRPSLHGESAYSVKGRYSFLPGTVMRLGLILLMASLLFSSHLRKTEEAVLHEGEEKTYFGKKVRLDAILSHLPEEFLQVGEEGVFKVEGISAVLSSQGKRYTVSAGFPSGIEGAYYRISHLGFSHPLSVRGGSGDFDKQIDLDILPPGKAHILTLPSGDLLTFSLQPERTISKGFLKGKEYSLLTPRYQVALHGGKDKSGGIMVNAGKSVSAGGTTISLGNRALFIKVKAVYDPALPWIYAGLVLVLLGMTLMVSRSFWYQKELVATFRDNVISVGYREEFYKRWGIQKFYRWREDIGSTLGTGRSASPILPGQAEGCASGYNQK